MFKPNPKDSETNQKYYRQSDNRTIAKVTVNGVDRYELWDGKVRRGYELTFNEAVNSKLWTD